MPTQTLFSFAAIADAYQNSAAEDVVQGDNLILGRRVDGFLRTGFCFLAAIPVGATIQRCVLTLTQDGGTGSPAGSQTLSFRVKMERSANASAFGQENANRSMFTRTLTTAAAEWRFLVPAYRAQYSTPDLSALLQEIVDLGSAITATTVIIEATEENADTTSWTSAAPYERKDVGGVSIPVLTIEYSLEPTVAESPVVPSPTATPVATTAGAMPDTVRRTTVGIAIPVRITEAVPQVNRAGSLGRQFLGTILRDRVPLGPGSAWMGSWRDVSAHRVKTFSVRTLGGSPSGNGGSFSLVAGFAGSGASGMTGTYYGPVLIRRGSFTTVSTQEAFQYARPVLYQGGYGRGTLSVGFTGRL